MCLLVLLDVKNAFYSIEWKVILDTLNKSKISPYVFHQDGWITEGDRIDGITVGIPHGSVLGPTPWNIAYDGAPFLEVLRNP